MKILVAFNVNCGWRTGTLEGLFICEKEKLEAAYGKSVYFGEVLGKHSDISVDLGPEDITIKSEDQDFISKFEQEITKRTHEAQMLKDGYTLKMVPGKTEQEWIKEGK